MVLLHFLIQGKTFTHCIIATMEITRSNKGGAKLCYQGYMYTKHATRKTQQWWKCVKRSSTGCKDSISTSLQNENPTTGHPTTMTQVRPM